MTKKIVILGAGYAGVHAAKKLAKKYKKNADVEITLIDKNPFHTLMTELHEVAGGRVPEESVKIELSKIFHRTKVKVVVDYIENVNTDKKLVTTTKGKFEYDYLIVGTGSEPAFFGVPGVKENGFTLWSLEDALKIREHIKSRFKAASYESDEAKRRKMLTFIVAGSGFTGIEMAGELLEWKTKLAYDYRVDVSEVNIMVVEAMSTILNMLDRKQADKAERYMLKHGVEVLKDSPIVEVTPDGIKLKNGKQIPTETLIWTCGVQANHEAADYGLKTVRAGRLEANEYMEAVGKEGVYVVGDIAYYEEEQGKPNPQIVEAAEQTAVTAVKNIVESIDSSGNKVPFKSNYHGFMVSIGGRYGVANLAGVKLSGFIAMVMKHLVNMYYLFTVNDVNAVYCYLQHEFFGMKDRRSIMRGHLSSKGNRLWLVPLRIFIGCLWLIEGGKKLFGEKLWDANMAAILKFDFSKVKIAIGADSWLKAGNINMPFEWLTDATAGASENADAAVETVKPILSSMPKIYEAVMKIMIPTPEMATLFQTMVVIMEIGMGLALIVGLFTFLASAASAFMVCNFVLSAMAGWDILWYFFGSIALMSGAGRTFGLDYYVMPWIHRTVREFWVGKRTPIYEVHGVK